MGDRKQPTPPPSDQDRPTQVKPPPPPAPPPKRFGQPPGETGRELTADEAEDAIRAAFKGIGQP